MQYYDLQYLYFISYYQLSMKITRTFEMLRLQPPSSTQSQSFNPKSPKFPIANKLALTSELKIKQEAARSPKTTQNFHHKPTTHLFGSGELNVLKPPSDKQPISVFNAYMEKKQSKNKLSTNAAKIQKSTKERHMGKIQELKKKIEELSLMKQRSKSREKGLPKSISKGKSKSQQKQPKSPEKKVKDLKSYEMKDAMQREKDRDKSKSKPKSKSKSKPKSKSESKSKTKSKHQKREEDYIFIEDEIMRVKNPEQIDNLLSDEKILTSTDYSKFKEKTKRVKVGQLEKYLYAFLQLEAYQDFVSSYNPIELLMFIINDLPNNEQLQIHKKLEQEIMEQQNRLFPAKQQKEFSIEDVCRGAIEIVEQKHETAKFVVQSLHDKTEQYTKQQKLNEWKSSKFRQILIAKNFLTFNDRDVVALQDLHEDEYLPRIGNQLRMELEEMMDGKDKDSARSHDHRELPVETMEPVATGVEDGELELIRRARQIKEAIRESITFRLGVQAGKFSQQLGPTQICTSLAAINEYLASLARFVMDNHAEEYLANVKKCYGLNVCTKLRNVRQGKYTAEPEGFQEVLPNQVFVAFEQEVVGVGDSEPEREKKYYEHVHNKCLFDLLNHHLAAFRPFYRNGQPLPWKSNSEFISSFFLSEDNMQDVLHNCVYNILSEAEHLCGVIIPGHYLLTLLPENMDVAENVLLENSCAEVVESMVVEKTMKLIHQEIKTAPKDYASDLVDTRLRLDICTKIEDFLFSELADEIQYFTK